MAEDREPHGYSYPNTSGDSDQIDVLRKRFDLRSHEALAQAYRQHAVESVATIRQSERQARAGEGQGGDEGRASRAGRYRAR